MQTTTQAISPYPNAGSIIESDGRDDRCANINVNNPTYTCEDHEKVIGLEISETADYRPTGIDSE